jgi:hypothetical protein
MTAEMGYGPLMPKDEYSWRVADLQKHQPVMPTKEQDYRARKEAFFYLVQHRLGRNFPDHKFDPLWAANERINNTWLTVVTVVTRSLSWKIRAMKKEYRKVLTEQEFSMFFGSEDL